VPVGESARSKRQAKKKAPDRAALALEPGEIRRSLGGFRRGGEDCFLVFLHDRQPVSEILRVIGARLVGDPKISTEEGGTQFRDKLFHRIGLPGAASFCVPYNTPKPCQYSEQFY
jgi:hypothetical protein